ncbi:efflux transporter outer membrane subunit [Silvimonas iriomotensis]|nr:efflux transporter outer membrane subunit [Silvimonas iriomotensis]
MKSSLNTTLTASLLTLCLSLSACVSPSGIHGSGSMMSPASLQSAQSLPMGGGRWPDTNWTDAFGDAQLKQLIAEALAANPSLAEARARLAAAQAFNESTQADRLPDVRADYAWTRTRYTENGLIPPPYSGSWQSDNRVVIGASYTLDFWGKLKQADLAALSQVQAQTAETEQVKLTLVTALTRTYNQLAGLYALRDLAQEERQRREEIEKLTHQRFSSGLDNAIERETSTSLSADSRADIVALNARITATQYKLAALAGAGPDRGLQLARPQQSAFSTPAIPDNLPADLVSRRPDLVAARWRIDSFGHEVESARADFYPDINLNAALGLNAFGFSRFLESSSRTVAAGPAIHLPIFDAGRLRAQLKLRYAEMDQAIAFYNQTLVSALDEAATDLNRIHTVSDQIAEAQTAATAARKAYAITQGQFDAGLTTQISVLRADLLVLFAERQLINLQTDQRDDAIALAAVLGGGFKSQADPNADLASANRE